MTVINTGLLTKGLKSNFFARFDATKTHFGDLATPIKSDAAIETYKWLGSTPRMREWGTGRLAKGIRTESYSVANEKYEATIEVDRDEISDDQTGQIKIRVQELAQHAATHKDYLIAQLLINGATAGFNAYDGKSYFADDHESGASGVQSNKLTYDVTDTDNPTTDEFKAALKQAVATMMAYKDDVGEPAVLSTDGLVIVCHPSLYFAALEAVSATVITNVMEGIARVVSFPWLSNASKWYLLKTDGVVRPFIFQDREPVEFSSLTEDSEEGFKREKYLYGARARYALTYALWQMAVQTDLV